MGHMLGSMVYLPGETRHTSVIPTPLEVIETCAQYLERHFGKRDKIFGEKKIKAVTKEERCKNAETLAPL